MAREPYFATCAPGIEPLLHAEVKALRVARVERQVGGVYFEGSEQDAWQANLRLRTAIRVLRRLARFAAPDADALHAGVGELAWERFLPPGGTLRVDAQTRDSALDHSRFVEQRAKDAVVDRFRARTGERPSVDKEAPDLRVHVHLFRDRATVSVDTSGSSLHRRGWRIHQGRAPLAETTAAALVLASGWNRRAPLVDPFCGTGTILVEAGWIAAGIAPGLRREFAFERWPGHDRRGWDRLKRAVANESSPAGKLVLQGFDVDAERVREAGEHASAAGLEGLVEVRQGDALDWRPRAGWNAWIVTNPPYGLRLGEEAEVERLYTDFGALLRAHCNGFHLTLLTGRALLAKKLGLAGTNRDTWVSGGLDCQVVRHESI